MEDHLTHDVCHVRRPRHLLVGERMRGPGDIGTEAAGPGR
jgi:hypothetical protein